MARQIFSGVLVLLTIFLASACQNVVRTEATAQPLFRELTFSEACTLAASQNKAVLVFFDGDWSEQSQPLLDNIFSQRDVDALVRERTIPLHLDVVAAPELTQRYHVRDVPLILLVAPDGRELDRWDGFENAADCKRELTAALAGESSVERLRAKVKPDDVKGRFKLGRRLIAAGNYAEALSEFTSLYHHPKAKKFGTPWSGSQTWIIRTLGGIQNDYPPAADTLRTWRREQETIALANPRNWQSAALVHTIDRSLRDDDHLIGFFRELAPGSPAQNHLKRPVFKVLSGRRAYEEATALMTSDEAVAALQRERHIPLVARGIVRIIVPFHAGRAIKAAHFATLSQRLAYFEAYAGVGDAATARRLARIIIAEDKSGRAIEGLRAIAKKARPADTEFFLVGLGIPELQTASTVAQ